MCDVLIVRLPQYVQDLKNRLNICIIETSFNLIRKTILMLVSIRNMLKRRVTNDEGKVRERERSE